MSATPVVIPCASCAKLNRVDLARVADDRATRAVCAACKAPLVVDAPLTLTDGNFDQIIAGSAVPVIVDFYADWCGPCKMMAPVFAELARRQQGSALVAKVDTDQNPLLATRFGIRSIPTLVVMRAGREVARQVGAVPLASLEQLVRTA